MSPVSTSPYGPRDHGFHEVVTVGQRGQVAISAKACGGLRIEAGTQLVILTDPNEGIALVPLGLLLSKRDNPVTELVRSVLPGVMQPDGESADEVADKHAGDAGKVADDDGDLR